MVYTEMEKLKIEMLFKEKTRPKRGPYSRKQEFIEYDSTMKKII